LQEIGGHLHEKPIEQWDQYIKGQTGWTGEDLTAVLRETIHPSYLALRFPVKRSFLTFAAFREEERILESQLLDIWAGWELSPGPHAYVAAKEYLKELEDACLIHRELEQPSSGMVCKQGGVVEPHFYLHCALRDLASSIAIEHKCVTGGTGDVRRPCFFKEVHFQAMSAIRASCCFYLASTAHALVSSD
jgi:hypothetical protein